MRRIVLFIFSCCACLAVTGCQTPGSLMDAGNFSAGRGIDSYYDQAENDPMRPGNYLSDKPVKTNCNHGGRFS